jgi:hypothetical protein
VANILIKEHKFFEKKKVILDELINAEDWKHKNAFRDMSWKDSDVVTMKLFQEFIKRTWLVQPPPTTEELEAILRRCDHDGVQNFDYMDFIDFIYQSSWYPDVPLPVKMEPKLDIYYNMPKGFGNKLKFSIQRRLQEHIVR